MFSTSTGLNSGQQRESVENQKSQLTSAGVSQCYACFHAARTSLFINRASDTGKLFKVLASLLCPAPPPPTSSLTADDFDKLHPPAVSSQLHSPSDSLHTLRADHLLSCWCNDQVSQCFCPYSVGLMHTNLRRASGWPRW